MSTAIVGSEAKKNGIRPEANEKWDLSWRHYENWKLLQSLKNHVMAFELLSGSGQGNLPPCPLRVPVNRIADCCTEFLLLKQLNRGILVIEAVDSNS